MRAALAPIRSAFHRCRGISFKSAAELRRACRSNTWTGPTAGEAPGYVQANLVILPGKYAEQFRDFCVKNAAPCPLLEHTGPGSFEPKHLAPGADLRTDLPKYHVWREGKMVEERQEVLGLCEDDMHGFLLGCSFTWEDLLAEAYLTPRHVEEGRNVPMFDSSIELRSAGPFQGHMVVSMRPYRKEDAEKVCAITGEFPAAHGPPVQIGQPAEIGVKDSCGRLSRHVPGPYETRLRRGSFIQRWGGPSVLGLWCHTTKCIEAGETAFSDHPCTWSHVRWRHSQR